MPINQNVSSPIFRKYKPPDSAALFISLDIFNVVAVDLHKLALHKINRGCSVAVACLIGPSNHVGERHIYHVIQRNGHFCQRDFYAPKTSLH